MSNIAAKRFLNGIAKESATPLNPSVVAHHKEDNDINDDEVEEEEIVDVNSLVAALKEDEQKSAAKENHPGENQEQNGINQSSNSIIPAPSSDYLSHPLPVPLDVELHTPKASSKKKNDQVIRSEELLESGSSNKGTDNTSSLHAVEKIVSHRRKGRGYQYRVRWEGCRPDEDTWENYYTLRHLDIFQAYLIEQTHKEKQQGRLNFTSGSSKSNSVTGQTADSEISTPESKEKGIEILSVSDVEETTDAEEDETEDESDEYEEEEEEEEESDDDQSEEEYQIPSSNKKKSGKKSPISKQTKPSLVAGKGRPIDLFSSRPGPLVSASSSSLFLMIKEIVGIFSPSSSQQPYYRCIVSYPDQFPSLPSFALSKSDELIEMNIPTHKLAGSKLESDYIIKRAQLERKSSPNKANTNKANPKKRVDEEYKYMEDNGDDEVEIVERQQGSAFKKQKTSTLSPVNISYVAPPPQYRRPCLAFNPVTRQLEYIDAK